MNLENGKIVEENEKYSFVLTADKTVLAFGWKHAAGLAVEDFQKGIAGFAAQCKTHKPARAVIDAAALDQGSPAVAWLRGQNPDTDREDYNTWWTRVVLPVLHEAGIVSLAVGTGDPNAPGELGQVPPGVNFKIGYFPDFDAAMAWH